MSVSLATLRAEAQHHQSSFGVAVAPDGRVDRGKFALFYRIIGNSGPLIVVLAGGPGGDPNYMKPVLDRLSTTHRCLLLEQRGTGRSKLTVYNDRSITFQSYLEDLEALRQHLKQPKLLLLGHSWGGMLALSYAGTFPNRVHGVVSIDAGPIAEEHAIAEEANAFRRLEAPEQARVLELEKRNAVEPTGGHCQLGREGRFWLRWVGSRDVASGRCHGLPDGEGSQT